MHERVSGVADKVLGWQPVTVPLTADTSVTADEVLWHGHVSLPAGRHHDQYRIVVSEYELLLTDASPREASTRRLVYTDTLWSESFLSAARRRRNEHPV